MRTVVYCKITSKLSCGMRNEEVGVFDKFPPVSQSK